MLLESSKKLLSIDKLIRDEVSKLEEMTNELGMEIFDVKFRLSLKDFTCYCTFCR